jgi:hypothetical protein
LNGRRADLEDEILPIAVDDEARDAIGLGVQEAVGVGVYLEDASTGSSRRVATRRVISLRGL